MTTSRSKRLGTQLPKYPKRPRLGAYKELPDGAQICTDTAAGKREYFNRTRLMAARQNELCAICNRFMIDPQFEHQEGRGMNGSHRDDRTEIDGEWHNAAVDGDCNIRKGSKRFKWVEGIYREVIRNDMEREVGSPHSDDHRAVSVARALGR